jgi:hypothetical protein
MDLLDRLLEHLESHVHFDQRRLQRLCRGSVWELWHLTCIRHVTKTHTLTLIRLYAKTVRIGDLGAQQAIAAMAISAHGQGQRVQAGCALDVRIEMVVAGRAR